MNQFVLNVYNELLITINAIPANHHLQVEIKRLEKVIIHSLTSIKFARCETFHFNTLSKLGHICDLLFALTKSINPDVIALIDLMAAIRTFVPDELQPRLKLPKAFLEMQKNGIADTWAHYSQIMQTRGISNKLIDIAGIPFQRFIHAKHTLYWGDFTWLKAYQAKLDIMEWENADGNSPEEALLSLLIGRDFNDDRFYNYCKKYIQNRIKKISGKRSKLLEYAGCEKLVLQDTQIGMSSFDGHANSVSVRLIKWIREEIDFVETHEREPPYAKLNFHFYKYTLSFFFKLLHEQKVFGDISFRELSEQIASTCTAMGSDVPADTIIKKAYLKKQVDFEKMETFLVSMLEYLRRFK